MARPSRPPRVPTTTPSLTPPKKRRATRGGAAGGGGRLQLQDEEAVTTTTSTTSRKKQKQSSPLDALNVLILRVLELEGYPLAPFLRLPDLWSLSLVARSLLPYRTLLPRVQLIKPPAFTDLRGRRRTSPLRVLSHMLSVQRCLYHIRIHEPGLLKTVLESMKTGHVPTLRALDLSRLRMNQNEAKLLAFSLKRGVLHRLEALDLSRGISFHGAASLDLIESLSQGACPKIRHLNLSYGFFSLSLGESLATALRSGHLCSLQSLDLSSTYMGPTGAAAVAMAVKEGLCPQLRSLNINHAHAGSAIQCLGEALEDRRCQLLEELRVAGNMGVTPEAMAPLINAIKTGACPFRYLGLGTLGLDQEVGTALALGLAAGKCVHLRGLELARNRHLADDTMVPVLEVLAGGACPQLTMLDISEVGMKRRGALALMKAIHGNKLPLLEDLRVSGNLIPKRDMTALVKTLGAGSCGRLRRLDLADQNMREGMGKALASTMVSGALPQLTSLNLSENNYVKDRHVASFLKVLADHPGACPLLRRLDLSFTGIGRSGCAALGKALQEGALMNLESLDLSRNGGITVDLPNALAQGAGARLRELDLRFGGEREVMKRLAGALRQGACPQLQVLRVLRYSLFFPEFEQAIKARTQRGGRAVIIE